MKYRADTPYSLINLPASVSSLGISWVQLKVHHTSYIIRWYIPQVHYFASINTNFVCPVIQYCQILLQILGLHFFFSKIFVSLSFLFKPYFTPFPTLFNNFLSGKSSRTSFCDIQALIQCHSEKLSSLLLNFIHNFHPMIALFHLEASVRTTKKVRNFKYLYTISTRVTLST